MIGLCISCSSNEDELTGGVTLKPTLKTKVEGMIEKGPFLTGSKVTLYELGADLKQTGKNIFKTETVDDNGSFAFDSRMELSSQYVELEISGYFYNEMKGRRSDSQITLNAIADISGKDNVNANILTHLEYKRVKVLVSKGSSFENAKKQAKQELLKNFCITTEIKTPDNISFTDGDENASILLAVSAILLDNRSEAEFSEFVARLGNEFAESGAITNKGLLDEIRTSQKRINTSAAIKNLTDYYKEQGKVVKFNPINKYIDRNGDGVLDEKDEFLDEAPKDSISEDEFFKKEEDFKAVLTSCYAGVSNYLQRTTVLDAVHCKQIDENLTINAYSPAIMEAWGSAYRVLRTLNLIIEKGEKITKFDTKPYTATAKTMRAMIYLDMVQHWGDVQFVTKVIVDINDAYISRTNKESIYSTLLTDLEAAVPSLKTTVDQKQCVLSKDLAYALMATIQLEKKEGDITAAAQNLKAILESGRYELAVNTTIYTAVDNKESLFSLSFADAEQSGGNNTPYYVFEKNLKHGMYHPIYRITGVALVYAEVLLRENKIAEMTKVINQVRAAQGLPPVAVVAEPAKTICELWRQIIATDYGYFALLKRRGLAVELLGIEAYQQLYPIPQNELMLNQKMIQNPGY